MLACSLGLRSAVCGGVVLCFFFGRGIVAAFAAKMEGLNHIGLSHEKEIEVSNFLRMCIGGEDKCGSGYLLARD